MDNECYRVIVKEGKQFLTYKGEILPNQIESNIVQTMEHLPCDGKTLCSVVIKCLAVLDESSVT